MLNRLRLPLAGVMVGSVLLAISFVVGYMPIGLVGTFCVALGALYLWDDQT